MGHLKESAPRRAQQICAKFASFSTLRSLLRSFRPGHKCKHVKHLSDHLARDIGLDRTEMERQRHVWPSESAERPGI